MGPTSTCSGNTDWSGIRTWKEGYKLAVDQTILPLSADNHKGSAGRIGILGGNAQYTGAPYYAAMASLKVGADLAYVFTAEEAAMPIKCYSPELMVLPVYSAKAMDILVQDGKQRHPDAKRLVKDMIDKVVPLLERLHSLVIGPGLGRCPLVFQAVAGIIQEAQKRNLHLIMDGDALYMLSLSDYRALFRNYDKIIITPNVMEYKRIFESDSYNPKDLASVVIVRKGKQDVIYKGETAVITCAEDGGLKRSGGIGDITAGSIGTLVAWHSILEAQTKNHDDQNKTNDSDDLLPFACWTACCFVRDATKTAFHKHDRSMTAPDVLSELGPSVKRMTRVFES